MINVFLFAQVTTNEEAFAEASSQLALAPPYTGDEEEEEEKEMVDNTEKREVSNVNAGLNIFVILDKCICHNF